MPVDVSALKARDAREKAQSEIDVFDVRVIVVATAWLAFYAVAALDAASNQTSAAAIDLAARY